MAFILRCGTSCVRLTQSPCGSKRSSTGRSRSDQPGTTSRFAICSAAAHGHLSRRDLALIAALSLPGGPCAPAAAADILGHHETTTLQSTTPTEQRMRPQLTFALTSSVHDALLQECKDLNESELEMEIYRLREREWPYYRRAQNASLPALPDLSDASGGMSNPVFFNFISYILWKVAARHVTHEDARVRVNMAAGQLLAERALRAPLALAASAAASNAALGSNRKASPQQMQEALVAALDILKSGGYVADYRVVWGGIPSLPVRPYGEPGLSPDLRPSDPNAGLQEFQVTLRAPADILGSVSLRGEEDGWFGHAASAALAAILAAGNWPCELPDEVFFQDEWRGPQSVWDRLLLLLGDPLQTVEVPWEPTSIIQDWRLS